jgi:acetylornithine deacetylase/succinyl-diaminopimelate desuccinylase-like protein
MRIVILVFVTFFFGQLKAQPAIKIFENYLSAHGPQIVSDYVTLLSIPNVANDLVNINRNADYLVNQLNQRGVETQLLTIDGVPPIVYGYLPGKNAKRTIALYVHYDGQPVDKTRWAHDPWDPKLYDKAMVDGGQPIPFPVSGTLIDPENRIYARSTGDDKAPIISILAALDAIKEQGLTLTSNFVFFFEGQEEAGSPQLRTYLEKYSTLLDQVDLWMFCDGPVHQSRQPQLVFGVRGVTGFEVTVYGSNRSLHSGHYGNWAPVPGQMISTLIASMKDANGNVIIKGFYDDVAPLSTYEIEAMANIPQIDVELRRELGLNDTEGTESLYERLLYPSLTIKGLSSGNVGAQAANVIPDIATAAIGVRLVKGNDPEKMVDLVERHIESQGYHIVRNDPDQATRLAYPKIAKITREEGYPAARTSMTNPFAQQVVARVKDVAGQDLILLPTLGGSLPLYLFTDVLKKPAIVVPIANHDNNQHTANENIRIENLWYGVKLMGAIMTMNP